MDDNIFRYIRKLVSVKMKNILPSMFSFNAFQEANLSSFMPHYLKIAMMYTQYYGGEFCWHQVCKENTKHTPVNMDFITWGT